MTRSLTLGVLGHVDHGKTALVRALTGIETDRLREERERGLSIVIGFAYLPTANGVIDLIDVPGHEGFIRAMIGGATSLDGIVLCVAANEGVMPQSVEHFDIARLLGIERGVVVITKTDLVDTEELALARSEIEDLVAGTFLQGAPVVEVSVASNTGIDRARDALSGIAEVVVPREDRGRFFLPLDRVFTMRGFGLVGTGTLRGSRLAVDDSVEILPARRTARIRALQNHGRAVAEAYPGQRVAVNLRNVDKDALRRGDVLATPGTIVPSKRLDVRLTLVGDAPEIRNGQSVRFLTGTTAASTRVRLLGRRKLKSGDSCMAQVELNREIATLPGEPFLIRSFSPARTLGGGSVVRVNADRHRRYDESVTSMLETAASGDARGIVRKQLDDAGIRGIRVGALALEFGVDPTTVKELAIESDALNIAGDRFVSAAACKAIDSCRLLPARRWRQKSFEP